jgi:hypothetical protein
MTWALLTFENCLHYSAETLQDCTDDAAFIHHFYSDTRRHGKVKLIELKLSERKYFISMTTNRGICHQRHSADVCLEVAMEYKLFCYRSKTLYSSGAMHCMGVLYWHIRKYAFPRNIGRFHMVWKTRKGAEIKKGENLKEIGRKKKINKEKFEVTRVHLIQKRGKHTVHKCKKNAWRADCHFRNDMQIKKNTENSHVLVN